MTKPLLLFSALCVLASAGISHAATVVFTIANSALNTLTLSGNVGGAPHTFQGTAGSLVDTYTGSITADLTGGVLTFSPGGDSLTAQLNASRPVGGFLPAGGGVDNYGVTVNAAAGGGVIAFRDLIFDITGGTMTNGAASTAIFGFSSGHADYNAPAFGAPGSLPLPPVTPVANSSPGLVSLLTVGSTQTLTIPITLTYPGPPSTTFNGQLVLQRTVPEPASFVFALAGLLGIFRRRR
jgi:hypothetical protein